MLVLDAFKSILEGEANTLWPIILVIMAPMLIYNLSLHTKSMDAIKNMIIGITIDKRILVLILAWGFDGLLEPIAGFSTYVVILGLIAYFITPMLGS